MKLFRDLTALLALVSGCFCSNLRAGTPFLTDDPGFVGKGQWEIKTEFVYEHHRDVDGDVLTAPLDINYSLIDHLKLNLTLNERTVYNSNGTAYSGLGDMDFKFKYRFLDEDEQSWKPAISIAPDVTIPTADKSRGLGDGITRFRLPFQFGKTIGKFGVFAETGYQILFDRKASDNVLYGAGFQYQLTERFSAGIELNGFTPLKQPQNHSLLTNMGLTYILTKNFQVQGSLGRTLRPDSFGGPKVLAQFFFQINF